MSIYTLAGHLLGELSTIMPAATDNRRFRKKRHEGRMPGALFAIFFLVGPSRAAGEPPPSCGAFPAAELAAAYQVYELPPLKESRPGYRLRHPGELTAEHARAISELLDRVFCATLAQNRPLPSVRFTIYGGTDNKGARAYIRAAIKKEGAPPPAAVVEGKIAVDTVAAWHRTSVVAAEIITALRRFSGPSGPLHGGDLELLVSRADMLTEPPPLTAQLASVTTHGHPRGFTVVVAISPASEQPLNAAPAPPVVVLCGACGDPCGSPQNGPSEEDRKRAEEAALRRQASLQAFLESLRKTQVELLAGVAVAVVPVTRDHAFHEVFVSRIGVRIPAGRVFRLNAQALFVYGKHPIVFTDASAPQRLLAGGGMLQLGFRLPLRSSFLEITPGLELGWLYVDRSIERMDYGHIGQPYHDAFDVVIAGAWMRFDFAIPPAPRLAISLELSGDSVPAHLRGDGTKDLEPNITAKVMGGLSYAFR